MIQALNALIRAICWNDPVIARTTVHRDDAIPGEWLDCKTTAPLDGETVIVATRDTYPHDWGKAMKAFMAGINLGYDAAIDEAVKNGAATKIRASIQWKGKE